MSAIIAGRTFDLIDADGQPDPIKIEIAAPFHLSESDMWTCEITIATQETSKSHLVYGSDSLQALAFGLSLLVTETNILMTQYKGRITLDGDGDLLSGLVLNLLHPETPNKHTA